MDRHTLEQIVKLEYEDHKGRILRATRVTQQRPKHDREFSFPDGLLVQVIETPESMILCWTDDQHIDPSWMVSPLDESYSDWRWYVAAPSRSTTGEVHFPRSWKTESDSDS